MNIYWENFYENWRCDDASPFAAFASASLKQHRLTHMLFDLGCGNGRDSRFFKANGWTVCSIDSSSVGLHMAESDTGSDLSIHGDVADAETWREILVRKGTHARTHSLFYARFLLHALDRAQQRTFCDLLIDAALIGDVVAFEYRTTQDAQLPKTYSGHDRYYVDHDCLVSQFAARQWTLLHAVESQGLSPWQTEDPWIGRIIARKRAA